MAVVCALSLLFLNTFAGISIISQEAPIFQELVGSRSSGGEHGGIGEHR